MTSAFYGKRLLPLILSLGLVSTPGLAAELPRQALLGVAVEPSEGEPRRGAVVQQVIDGLSAAAMGVRPGDLVVAAGGKAVTNPDDIVLYARRLKAGDPVDLTVIRNGRELRLRGLAAARPLESYSAASADYGAVPFDGGLLRDVLVSPDGVDKPPVVFLIQGFSCATIESLDPNSPYRRLAQLLAEGGIATYRVEKPGVGDSTDGRQHCTEMDFAGELESFRSAYRHLIEQRGFDPGRIFMLGHSMGGIQAPLLAAERSPRGVAVFGTVLRNWADYHLALYTFQSFLMRGEDPAEEMAATERNRELFQLFYFDRRSPSDIAAERPELSEPLRNALAWDGGEQMMGRHYRFMQDLAELRLGAAWRDTRSNVLAIYGEADLVALFNTDHILIADIANHYRPGTGRYVEVEATDHGMMKVGNRADFRRGRAEGANPSGPFNQEVAALVRDWVVESLARPPVGAAEQRPITTP